jgi:putative RNA 2'-phosphotransferase
MAERGSPISRAELDEILQSSEERRFALSSDQQSLIASQVHSEGDADTQARPKVPPPRLFHGTFAKSIDLIETRDSCP